MPSCPGPLVTSRLGSFVSFTIRNLSGLYTFSSVLCCSQLLSPLQAPLSSPSPSDSLLGFPRPGTAPSKRPAMLASQLRTPCCGPGFPGALGSRSLETHPSAWPHCSLQSPLRACGKIRKRPRAIPNSSFSTLGKGADASLFMHFVTSSPKQREPPERGKSQWSCGQTLHQATRAIWWGVSPGGCAILGWSHKGTSPLGVPPSPITPIYS